VTLCAVAALLTVNPTPAVGAQTVQIAAPLTEVQAAQDYLNAVAPVNVAEPQFYAQAETWSATTTDSEAQAAAMPLVDALTTVEERLLSIADGYPPAASQLRTDAQAVKTLLDDLGELSRLQSIGIDAWAQRYDGDRGTLTADSNAVRSALGLASTSEPPPVAGVEPSTPAAPNQPCKCTSLVLTSTPEVVVRANDQIREVRYPYVLRIAMTWTLTCTGGTGSCSGRIYALAPAGWTTKYLGFDPYPTPGTGPLSRVATVKCSGTCGAPQKVKVFLWAETGNDIKVAPNGIAIWAFESSCSDAATLQHLVLGFDAAGHILLGGHHQHPTDPITFTPPTPVATPCHCSQLDIARPTHIAATAGSAEGTAFTRLSIELPYSLACTGVPGQCLAHIRVTAPPGWHGTDWYQAVPTRQRNGTTINRPGKAVGGLDEHGALSHDDLVVTCTGSCAAVTNGSFFVLSRAERAFSDTSVTFTFEITCGAVRTTKAVTVFFSRSGSTLPTMTELNDVGTPPVAKRPPVESTPRCQCTSVDLETAGAPNYASSEERSVLNIRVNWDLRCDSLAAVETDCSVPVKLEAPPSVQARLYSASSTGGPAESGVTLTCAGICEAAKPPQGSGEGETTGSFMLGAIIDGPLSVGRTFNFKLSAECFEGERTNFVLKVKVLRHFKLAYGMYPG